MFLANASLYISYDTFGSSFNICDKNDYDTFNNGLSLNILHSYTNPSSSTFSAKC
jgi:hypothetical protein